MNAQEQDIVDEYLLDGDAHAAGHALLMEKYSELEGRENELISLERSLVRGEIQYSDVSDIVGQAFGMSAERATQFARDFVGYYLAPIAKYVPDIIAAFVAGGGALEAYSTSGNAYGSFDIEERAEALQEIKELPPLDPIPAPVKDAHPLPPPAPVAPPVLSSKPAPMASQKPLVSAPAASAATVRPVAPVAAMTHALATSIPVVNGEFMTEAERVEIEQHKAAATQAAKRAEESSVQVSKDAQELTEKAWPHVKGSKLTKTMLGQLIDTVLRGIRSAESFERKLMDEYGLSFDQVSEVDDLIGDYQFTHQAQPTVKATQAQATTPIAKALAPKAPPAAPMGAPVSAPTSFAPKVNFTEPEPKPVVAPKPAKAEVSTPTVHPSLHGEQKVTDIFYKKQTLGPIDELATMGPADFRLLASRVQDIPDVVAAKIDGIAEDGFEEKLKAVRAWRQSPVNLLYVRLLRDAMMSQKPLPEVIAAERAKGNEVLSPAEIDAIMAINKRLG